MPCMQLNVCAQDLLYSHDSEFHFHQNQRCANFTVDPL